MKGIIGKIATYNRLIIELGPVRSGTDVSLLLYIML